MTDTQKLLERKAELESEIERIQNQEAFFPITCGILIEKAQAELDAINATLERIAEAVG